MEILLSEAFHTISYDPKNNITYQWIEGDHDLESAQKAVKIMERLSKKLGKPLLLLVDVSEGDMVHAEARGEYARFCSLPVLEKAAFVLTSLLMRTIVKMVFSVSGQQQKMRIFKDKESALVWLQS